MGRAAEGEAGMAAMPPIGMTGSATDVWGAFGINFINCGILSSGQRAGQEVECPASLENFRSFPVDIVQQEGALAKAGN